MKQTAVKVLSVHIDTDDSKLDNYKAVRLMELKASTPTKIYATGNPITDWNTCMEDKRLGKFELVLSRSCYQFWLEHERIYQFNKKTQLVSLKNTANLIARAYGNEFDRPIIDTFTSCNLTWQELEELLESLPDYGTFRPMEILEVLEEVKHHVASWVFAKIDHNPILYAKPLTGSFATQTEEERKKEHSKKLDILSSKPLMVRLHLVEASLCARGDFNKFRIIWPVFVNLTLDINSFPYIRYDWF